MKAVMISIQPKWCELISSGKKTIEVRKTRPKIETPFKCYIYATKPKKWFRFSSIGFTSNEILWLSDGKVKMCDGFEFWADGKEYQPLCRKVIGEFVCDRIDNFLVFENGSVQYWNYHDLEKSCLTYDEISKYIGKNREGYGWHISDLVIYDKPRELSEFYLQCEEYGKTGTIDTPKKCKKCRYQYTWDLVSKCRIDGKRPITRPPRSWQYVEELKENEK